MWTGGSQRNVQLYQKNYVPCQPRGTGGETPCAVRVNQWLPVICRCRQACNQRADESRGTRTSVWSNFRRRRV